MKRVPSTVIPFGLAITTCARDPSTSTGPRNTLRAFDVTSLTIVFASMPRLSRPTPGLATEKAE
jgi:hypothetical protein